MEALLLPPHQLNEVAVYLQNVFLFSFRVMMKQKQQMHKLLDCCMYISQLPSSERRLYPSPLYPTTMSEHERLVHMSKVRFPLMETTAMFLIRWISSYPEDFVGQKSVKLREMSMTIADDCSLIQLLDLSNRIKEAIKVLSNTDDNNDNNNDEKVEMEAIPVMRMFSSLFDIPTDVLVHSRLVLNKRGTLKVKETIGENQVSGKIDVKGLKEINMCESEFMGASRLSGGIATQETIKYWNETVPAKTVHEDDNTGTSPPLFILHP